MGIRTGISVPVDIHNVDIIYAVTYTSLKFLPGHSGNVAVVVKFTSPSVAGTFDFRHGVTQGKTLKDKQSQRAFGANDFAPLESI